ncbi:hypothetical protein QE152_g7931 [Popillia japonica]|uniref:Uncharacterized protein n=1 Tax=Popillia japonica TaxID=7064 RepID=A0AAW1MC14_POPJA
MDLKRRITGALKRFESIKETQPQINGPEEANNGLLDKENIASKWAKNLGQFMCLLKIAIASKWAKTAGKIGQQGGDISFRDIRLHSG